MRIVFILGLLFFHQSVLPMEKTEHRLPIFQEVTTKQQEIRNLSLIERLLGTAAQENTVGLSLIERLSPLKPYMKIINKEVNRDPFIGLGTAALGFGSMITVASKYGLNQIAQMKEVQMCHMQEESELSYEVCVYYGGLWIGFGLAMNLMGSKKLYNKCREYYHYEDYKKDM